MARDEVGLVGQTDAALGLQHAQRRNGIGHDRGLCVLGQRQSVFGALRHDRGQFLAQRIIDLFENLTGNGAGRSQFDAHTNLLAALTRKNESPHCAIIPDKCKVGAGYCG
jgi:hypothetical protein